MNTRWWAARVGRAAVMVGETPDAAVVAARFSAAATRYDAAAAVQRAAAATLVELLPADWSPATILDMGCGTGELARRLHEVRPAAAIRGIDFAPGMVEQAARQLPAEARIAFSCEDIERVAVGSAGLIASSFALQWVADGPGLVQRWGRELGAGAGLAIAVPVAGTLAELAAAYRRETGRLFPGLHYPTAAAYRDAVVAAGLSIRAERVVEQAVTAVSGQRALHALKALGATASVRGHVPAPVGAMRRIMAACEQGTDGARLPFRVLLLIAQRPVPLTGAG